MDGRIPSPYEASRAHQRRGPSYTHIKPTHLTVGFEPGSLRSRLYRGVMRLLSQRKRNGRVGMLGVVAKTSPPGLNDRRPENGTNDLLKVPAMLLSRYIDRARACMRALPRLAEFRASGRPAIIGLRKRQS